MIVNELPYLFHNSLSVAMSALAGARPGGPVLDQHHFAAIVGQIDGASQRALAAQGRSTLPTESSRVCAPAAFLAAGESGNSLTIRTYHFFASSSWPVNSWLIANWSMASAASGAVG